MFNEDDTPQPRSVWIAAVALAVLLIVACAS